MSTGIRILVPIVLVAGLLAGLLTTTPTVASDNNIESRFLSLKVSPDGEWVALTEELGPFFILLVTKRFQENSLCLSRAVSGSGAFDWGPDSVLTYVRITGTKTRGVCSFDPTSWNEICFDQW